MSEDNKGLEYLRQKLATYNQEQLKLMLKFFTQEKKRRSRSKKKKPAA